jgi:hypothetical protein
MPEFGVGDHVVRIGSLIPAYMKSGVIIRVIPDKDGIDRFTQYEVKVQNEQIVVCYETQLRLVKAAENSKPM